MDDEGTDEMNGIDDQKYENFAKSCMTHGGDSNDSNDLKYAEECSISSFSTLGGLSHL